MATFFALAADHLALMAALSAQNAHRMGLDGYDAVFACEREASCGFAMAAAGLFLLSRVV